MNTTAEIQSKMAKLMDESCRLSPFLVANSNPYGISKSERHAIVTLVSLPSIKDLLSPSKSSSKMPTFVPINNHNDREQEMTQSQPIQLQWCSKKIKNLPLSKGLSSQTKKLKVILMARVEQENKCLAICYSNEFIVRSHQSQLSPKTKALRRQLVENKKFKQIAKNFVHVGHHPTNQPKFYITNVGEEQVQERNIMGEMSTEGRYPVVHFDGEFFQQSLEHTNPARVWLDFCLVDPRSNQVSQLLVPSSSTQTETTYCTSESSNKRKKSFPEGFPEIEVVDNYPIQGHHWKKTRLLDGTAFNVQRPVNLNMPLSNGFSTDFTPKHTPIPLSKIQYSNQLATPLLWASQGH